MAVVRSARWLPLLVVALALLAARPMADVLVQPVLQAVPPAGRILPGGTIGLSTEVDWAFFEGDAPVCLDVRIEPTTDSGLSAPGTWDWVCPHTVAETILLPPRAAGVLLVAWNGTEQRIPFLVP